MWFLYRVAGSTKSNLKLLTRLRPGQRYALKVKVEGSSENQKAVDIHVDPFEKKYVAVPTERPKLTLYRNNHGVIVDNRKVTEQDFTLHDQNLMYIGKSTTGYKLVWIPLVILHEKDKNTEVHENLVELALQAGFHVIQSIKKDLPTHYCISTDLQDYIPSYNTFLSLATNTTFFINPQWVDELCQLADTKTDLKALNEKITPLEVKEFDLTGQTAIFGPDSRRRKLFNKMDFWFFDQQQLENSEKLVSLAGGKSVFKTFAQVMDAEIETTALLVTPPNAETLEGWEHVIDKYCHDMGTVRALLDTEIKYAILCCSTNYLCNPAARPEDHMDPNSLLYASFQSSSFRPWSSVKDEELDATIAVSVPIDDYDYHRLPHHIDDENPHQSYHSNDGLAKVKYEPVDELQTPHISHEHTRREIKQEPEDEEMAESHAPINNRSPIPQASHYDEPMGENADHTTEANADHTTEENADPMVEENADPVVDESVTADSPAVPSLSVHNDVEAHDEEEEEEEDDMDVGNFLNFAFDNLNTQKQKEKESKLKQQKELEAKRKEEERQQEQQRQEEEAREKTITERRLELEAEYEEELCQRNTALANVNGTEDVEMEPLEGGGYESPQEEEETQEIQEATQTQGEFQTQLDQDTSNTAPPQPSNVDYSNDPTVLKISEPDPNQGKYSRIIYRNLEVNPQPARPRSGGGGVNYKKFKKVKQFENYSSFNWSQVPDPTPATSSSQINRRRARDIFIDIDPGTIVAPDPDIMIRVNRPRLR